MEQVGLGLRAADLTIRVVKGVVRRLPTRLRKALDDRFFGAVFQVTRVTNDAYGWRPAGEPGAEEPGPG